MISLFFFFFLQQFTFFALITSVYIHHAKLNYVPVVYENCVISNLYSGSMMDCTSFQIQ